MSTFGAAFDKLPRETQRDLCAQLRCRKKLYLEALQRVYSSDTKVVLVADKPGPGRPTTPGFHHTPFCGMKYSSLWINRLLLEAEIPEQHLLWFNAELADGTLLDPIHLSDLATLNPTVIALGGNAGKYLTKHAPGVRFERVHHPQFAKRFKSKEPYALIDLLRQVCYNASKESTK